MLRAVIVKKSRGFIFIYRLHATALLKNLGMRYILNHKF